MAYNNKLKTVRNELFLSDCYPPFFNGVLIFSCFSYFNTVYCFHVKQNNKKKEDE